MAGGSQSAVAREPIRRQFGSKYKFTLAGYSYRDLLTGESPKCTLEDLVGLRKFRVETGPSPPPTISPSL